jgi:transcriptional regulator with XRE-family HTH domain
MARKAEPKPGRLKPTYLKAWRRKKGFTQAEFIGRLDVLLEGVPPEERKVPKTTASLSRIESGDQPYSQQSLEAFAAVLDIESWQLLGDDPTKDSTVISLPQRLTNDEVERLRRIAGEMFPQAASSG